MATTVPVTAATNHMDAATTKPATIVIACQIDPSKIEVARREIAAIIATVVAKEPACRGIYLHEDMDNPNRLVLIEYWDSKETFTGPHMQTPHMQAFLQRATRFLANAPEFRYCRQIAAAPGSCS
jgi:quinol monooxygenase YgiN